MYGYSETRQDEVNIETELLISNYPSKQKVTTSRTTTTTTTTSSPHRRRQRRLNEKISIVIDDYLFDYASNEIMMDNEEEIGRAQLVCESKREIMNSEWHEIESSQVAHNETNDDEDDDDDDDDVDGYDAFDVEIAENLLGLFVVSFDARQGNMIEWQIPTSLDLDSIEFKAMASGFHLMPSDIVYFRKDDMYGLAAFESLRIDSTEERNIRMKSVGMMSYSFKFLKKYVGFLKNQVKILLDQPGRYDQLVRLWHHKQIDETLPISTNKDGHAYLPLASTTTTVNTKTTTAHSPHTDQQSSSSTSDPSFIDRLFSKRSLIYRHSSHHQTRSAARSYYKFAHYFGASIFSLWKLALLNKRMLFYSSPPIGDLCMRVYCTLDMTHTQLQPIRRKQTASLKPYFFVNVADIDILQHESFYIACTTEKILEIKSYLFDVYINDATLVGTIGESQKNLLKVNSYDKKRYDSLMKKLKSSASNADAKSIDSSEEELFINFFGDLNDKLFTMLLDYELGIDETMLNKSDSFSLRPKTTSPNTDEPTTAKRLTNDYIKQIGLDPNDDKDFLNELIHFYDFNIRV